MIASDAGCRKLLIFILDMADYASRIVGEVDGERGRSRFIQAVGGSSGRDADAYWLGMKADQLRQFEKWLDPDTPLGACELLELLDRCDDDIAAYREAIQSNLDGVGWCVNCRDCAYSNKDKGLYRNSPKWYVCENEDAPDYGDRVPLGHACRKGVRRD